MTTEQSARVTAYMAERLRAEAFGRRISQGAIAEKISLSRSAVNEYLNGRTQIPIGVYLDICAAIGLDAEGIMREARESA